MSISPAQCRVARALLDMYQMTLAHKAVVPRDLLADIEAGVRYPSENNLSAIRTALEEAGVMFLSEDSEGWATGEAQEEVEAVS
jgi:predicted transcriptional regulator